MKFQISEQHATFFYFVFCYLDIGIFLVFVVCDLEFAETVIRFRALGRSCLIYQV